MLGSAFNYALKNWDHKGVGSIFEFGVASGTTFAWMAGKIYELCVPIVLVGFDSFAGLPDEAEGIWRPPVHQVGGFAYGREHVERKLRERNLAGDYRFQLVSGFYSESLKGEEAIRVRKATRNLLLVTVDSDLYISAMQLLDYIKPVLRVGTVLHFDDWKSPEYDDITEPWGEHRAWAEWSAANPSVKAETIEISKMNDRYMVVTQV